jgi:hypothetical protein
VRIISEEVQRKKMLARKRAGLSLAGIGGLLYLIGGFIFLTTATYYNFGISFPISYLVTGVISITGTIIGIKQVKLGGTVILNAIPVAILITLISSFYIDAYYTIIYLILPIYPIPYFPYISFIIIGGVLCRMSSD